MVANILLSSRVHLLVYFYLETNHMHVVLFFVNAKISVCLRIVCMYSVLLQSFFDICYQYQRQIGQL